MRQFVYPLRRKPGMTREEFQKYWRHTHGPLVASVAKVLGIRRYVQVYTPLDEGPHTDPTRGQMEEPFDGIAELWFERESATGTPEERAAAARLLAEDEANFIDFSRSMMWTGDERVVVGSETKV